MIARFLLLAGVASASFIASTASAQDAAQPVADSAEQATARGEVIIVTARRRAETAQEVPLAISVIRGDSIEATGNFNVVKLQQLAPTLQVYTTNPRNTSVNIRGLGVPFGLTSDGFEQGVGIYVDDVYNSRVAAATFDFLDVAQVEVLRGPQGTLYGKNTTAGAINITTNQPTFDFEGRAELTVGNLNYKQAKAAISGPLSDTIAARIAVAATSRRGTIYNVTSQRWINEQDNLGIRGQLLFKPTDNFSLTLSGDYSKQDPECCGTVFVRVGTTQRPITRQYDELVKAINANPNPAYPGRNYAVPSRNPYDRLTDLDSNLNAGNKIGGVSARIKWDVGPGTLTSVTAWRFWDWKPENDRDFTGLSVVSKSQNPSQQDQYSQEFRYNYESQKIDFVVGLFGFKQRIDTQGTEQQGADASRWSLTGANAGNPSILQGLTATNTQWLKSTSAALFGQLSWKVTDALTIQPGARLNYDKKSGFYQRVVTTGSGAVINSCAPTATQGNAVLTAQCGVYQPQLSAPSDSAWNFTYDFNVNYKIAQDILAYATYAKSFKTLGINQNGLPLNSDNTVNYAVGTVKPERVNHFEVGLKTQFWDRRATFNLTAFRTEIENFQATVNGGQFGTTRGYLANADKVRSQGIEADFKVVASDRFTAYANGAYTDAKYVKFCNAPPPPELSGGSSTGIAVTGRCTYTGTPGSAATANQVSPPFVDISGERLPGVSKWAFSYGAEYNIPVTLLDKDGQLYLGVDGNYRSHWNSNASPSIYTEVKGYALTNFRAGFRGEGFDIFGWVRNAFDVNYIENLQVAPGNTGLIAGQPGDPQTWGGTIKFSF
ncbi:MULTISPECIES: TonB-dependent receptor [Sphingobium]|uniref:TonB-dependent receptor n=1 Tax=Sphingobium fuliginis (strain ATCC 27551) TaxID=336203 RepID=A0A292ZEI1_SPHSA|nr:MULTISPECIES: TonB-dependent receptor [Sphingobium]AJR24774.1 TonB-dependent receptor [Sphingobium sp. YBL2]RYL99319.1 TonB-dependent receptor [Sphingobium fuliginis]UXC91124.1 TonB-dependent receptor [Sphingobium sp. RSMS]WDA36864.1 TonB-dependent receptor [Sphingobium sp. YC-XJ3]GAY23132.1 TonB-dependent receptor [Sphingobium fuliginis]